MNKQMRFELKLGRALPNPRLGAVMRTKSRDSAPVIHPRYQKQTIAEILDIAKTRASGRGAFSVLNKIWFGHLLWIYRNGCRLACYSSYQTWHWNATRINSIQIFKFQNVFVLRNATLTEKSNKISGQNPATRTLLLVNIFRDFGDRIVLRNIIRKQQIFLKNRIEQKADHNKSGMERKQMFFLRRCIISCFFACECKSNRIIRYRTEN